VSAKASIRGDMNLKIRDNLLMGGMFLLNRLGRIHINKLTPEVVKDSSGILVVVTTALGDAIFCTPLLRALKQAFPDKKIGLFAHRSYVDLFLEDDNIDVVVPYYGKFKKALKTWRRLKEESFDIALVANMNDPDVLPLLYWSGIRTIVRRPWKSTIYPFLVCNPEMMGTGEPPDHAIPMNLLMAEMLGAKSDNIRTGLSLRSRSVGKISKLFEDYGIRKNDRMACFHPGSAFTGKMWPAPHYAGLAKRILADYPGTRIFLTGTQKERKICSEIAKEAGCGIINMAGELSLGDVAALIREMDLFVSGDTGPFHIANALGIKTVTIFGPSDEKTNGPIWDLDIHKVVLNRMKCYYENCVRRCKNPECIQIITADSVYEECRKLLNAEGAKA
jgi:ADP-heptose:LPS heptosyltransferase